MLSWLKNNKFLVVVLFLLAFFGFERFRYYLPQPMSFGNSSMSESASFGYDGGIGIAGAPALDMAVGKSLVAPSTRDYYEPVSDASNRLVIQNSNMSLLVSDVRETGDKIIDFVKSKGGFMVDASYNRPEESAYGTLTVRVPTQDLDTTLEFMRGLSVKVTNEYIQGTDVTEQYTDIEERLSTLEKTKAKFEEILDTATEVQDILQVQQQLIYIQDQIDSLVGQRDALEKNASLTKITAYLSSDELSLPYTPDQKFRPNVIFKLAVRSLLLTLQNFGEFIIWALVYSVIWIPAVILFIIVRRFLRKKSI